MKAVILAAGYATRLYPLTKNQAKPLLPIARKPIIEHIIEKIEELPVDEIFVVTNHKFFDHFEEWEKKFSCSKEVKIVNDGTTSDEDKLGAIGDIDLVIKTHTIDDDLIVIAGDNLFELSLLEVFNFFKEKKVSINVAHHIKDKELLKHMGIIEIDKDNKMIGFEEKPAEPKTNLASAVIYLLPREIVKLIRTFIEQGNDPDKPGNFLQWLYKEHDVYCYISDKKWYDIGNLAGYEEAKKVWKCKQ